MKKLITMFFVILLMIQMLTGCAVNPKNINDAISNYYLVNQPNNNGQLKILATNKDDDKTFVLSEKYSGDGHIFTDIFVIDKDFNINYIATGQTAISPCFIVNSAVLGENRIVFGDYNNKRWDPVTDIVHDVDLKGIKLKFSDGTTIQQDFIGSNGYIVIADTTAKITEAHVYEKDEMVVSTLLETSNNETAFMELFPQK